MVKYAFKDITTVPSSESFVDIMLSKTNRQTPTIVRAKWKISSIRGFYMRKVQFTQQNIVTRLDKIITEFPRLDSIHPFYADLMNVLYDRDHYKIALSQLNICKQLVSNIGKDYIKLLKYGDSLYRCKMLKKAALGRMAKLIRQQKASFAYLEQVRQHLGRLPTIDPYAKTILLTGFPSTGKSSFMNKITKADCEVAPYPFTTKALFVGHSDFNYLRYQVIDSPGILDRPLAERNTIEMQAVTALAHLNATICYFIDMSPICNYSIEEQCKLFYSLSPLFGDKPIVVVCNKIDLRPFEELEVSEQQFITKLSKTKNVTMMEMSNEEEVNVMKVRNTACELLLDHRVQTKTASSDPKMKQIEDRLFVAQPQKRDNKQRETVRKDTLPAPRRRAILKRNIKEVVAENGGNGVFNFDTRLHWQLERDEWTWDCVPQFYDGKNVLDFYHENVERDCEELEREERALLIADIEAEPERERLAMLSMLSADDQLLHRYISRKVYFAKKESSEKAKLRNHKPIMGRQQKKTPLSQLKEKLGDLGIDTEKVEKSVVGEDRKRNEALDRRRRGRSRTRTTPSERVSTSSTRPSDNVHSGKDIQDIARRQSRSRSRAEKADPNYRSRSRSRSRVKGPSKGISSLRASKKADDLMKAALRSLNRQGKMNASDKHIYTQRPVHLFKGKQKHCAGR